MDLEAVLTHEKKASHNITAAFFNTSFLSLPEKIPGQGVRGKKRKPSDRKAFSYELIYLYRGRSPA
jgi:hypothetical protein